MNKTGSKLQVFLIFKYLFWILNFCFGLNFEIHRFLITSGSREGVAQQSFSHFNLAFGKMMKHTIHYDVIKHLILEYNNLTQIKEFKSLYIFHFHNSQAR
ncbi:hypothetical protein ACJX0J_025017 [Zea mays]